MDEGRFSSSVHSIDERSGRTPASPHALKFKVGTIRVLVACRATGIALYVVALVVP